MEYLIALGIIIIILVFFKSPTGKGIIGEKVVQLAIGRNKPQKGQYSVHNLTFYDGTKSVQIDHIVINSAGLHVIETKNYAGRIYGEEHQANWTQVLAYGKVKHPLYNPIKQNAGHIYSLKKVLNRKVDFHSYIVFTGRAELRVKATTTPVLYPLRLKRTIRRTQPRGIFLNQEEVVRLYNEIIDLKKNNTITKKEHVQGIYQRQQERNSRNTNYRK